MADDIQIHKSSSCLEYITLPERATKNHQGGLNSSENEAAAVMLEMSRVSCEDLPCRSETSNVKLFGRNQKLQSDEIQLCRCLVLQRSAWKTQVGEPGLFLRCPKKQDWLPTTLHIVCEPPL